MLKKIDKNDDRIKLIKIDFQQKMHSLGHGGVIKSGNRTIIEDPTLALYQVQKEREMNAKLKNEIRMLKRGDPDTISTNSKNTINLAFGTSPANQETFGFNKPQPTAAFRAPEVER